MRRSCLLVPLVLLAITGCGGSGAGPVAAAPSPTTSPTPVLHGRAAFLADMASLYSTFAEPQFRRPTLHIGTGICSMLSRGLRYDQVIRYNIRPAEQGGHISLTTDDEDHIVRSAVANLCPELARRLPG